MESFPRAGFRRRLGSWVYDFLVACAIYMTIGLITSAIFSTLFAHGLITSHEFTNASDYATQSLLYKIIVNGLAFSLISLFFIYFWSRSGQTLGMRAWRLRVQTQQGNLISKVTGLKRLIPTLFGLGNITVIFDRKNKLSLQDRLTNTEVVILSLAANKGANWSNGE
ncbi:MAG: RDD family protein [Thalassotalea sp.]